MKMIYLVVILLIGVFFTVIGCLFKIMHWPGAAVFLVMGVSVKVLAIILMIVKLLRSEKAKHISNQ